MCRGLGGSGGQEWCGRCSKQGAIGGKGKKANASGRLSAKHSMAKEAYAVCGAVVPVPQVKLVLQRNKFLVESPYPEVLQELLQDETISKARVAPEEEDTGGGGFTVSRRLAESAAADLAKVEAIDLTADGGDAVVVVDGGDGGDVQMAEGEEPEGEGDVHAFEIDPAQARWLPVHMDGFGHGGSKP
jgi:hypothetical protein